MSEARATCESEAVRTVPNHDLPCEQGTDLVVFQTVVIMDSAKHFSYLYTLLTNDEALDYL